MSRDEPSDWWSLIGPVPTPNPAGIIAVPHDRTAYLDQEYEIGPLLVRPGGRRLVEYLRSEPYQMNGVTEFESWPIIVEGKWSTVGERQPVGVVGSEADIATASSEIHRAVCLVSFAFNETWQVRTAPVEMTAFPPGVPEDWPPPDTAAAGLASDRPDPWPRALPEWVAPAWQALDEDEALASAMSVWHQGMVLTAGSPSFAFVAFCAAIEGIAGSKPVRKRLGPLPDPCPQCGTVPKASARFWATVSLVRSAENLAHLKKRVDPYGRRSDTAHGRALHGIETQYGRMHKLVCNPAANGVPASINLNATDVTQTFMWQELPAMRQVARDLLRLVLEVPETE